METVVFSVVTNYYLFIRVVSASERCCSRYQFVYRKGMFSLYCCTCIYAANRITVCFTRDPNTVFRPKLYKSPVNNVEVLMFPLCVFPTLKLQYF